MRPLIVPGLVAALAVALCAPAAHAGRHVVQRGETLEHVAQIYGCSVDAVLRANHLTNTLVRPGTVVTVPTCSVKARPRTRPRRTAADDLDDRAQQALAVIDGARVVESARPEAIARAEPAEATDDDDHDDLDGDGVPWHGRLRHGAALPAGDGYRIRRPTRAYGAGYVVDHLTHAIAEVRALYPEVHTLAIGDLSQRGGGRIGDHHSHQSGLDVDVGFYFTRIPAGYPDRFAAANADFDLEANWALLTAFARTADLPTGVQVIFLDKDIRARLYRYARSRGTPDGDLDAVFGLVQHWPNHTDHFHVRFKHAR